MRRGQKTLLPAIRTLCENRWYIDAIYRVAFVQPALALARLCFGVETRGLDGAADRIGEGTVATGRRTARAHAGRLQIYVGVAVLLVAGFALYLGMN